MADLSTCVPAVPHELHGIRATLAGWLTGQGINGHTRNELVLIVSELVTNAIEVSRSAESEVRVSAWRDGDLVTLEVDDDGDGFEPAARAEIGLPPASAVRGRGLPIVEALVDHLAVERHGLRTFVRVERHLTPSSSWP